MVAAATAPAGAQAVPAPARGAGLGRAAGSRSRPSRPTEVRAEIQALRALAVALVVAYHVAPAAVPGGFVGVDVFFAISGFLITGLLLREMEASGRIALAAFWARRARRLLPAALLTILACAAATAAIVPPSHWEQFFAEMRASAAYAQNWQLAADAVDYLAAENAPSPVQHFWSLSAEEQFYVVVPVLLVAALALTRRRPARARRRAAALVLFALTGLSLAYSIDQTAADPAAAYFVTPARAWEFGAGALLALAPPPILSGTARAALSWLGLGAIALAALTYSDATSFPGHAALLPVLGAIAVMRAGAPRHPAAPTPGFELRPVRFAGDISYSLYLWHWPLLVLAPFALGRELRGGATVAVVLLTVLVASLSKLLVEDPVRAGVLSRRRPRATLALAAGATAAVVALTLVAGAHVAAQVRGAERVTQRVMAADPPCFGAAARDPQRPCENPRLRLTVVPTPVEARGLTHPCNEILRLEGKKVCAFGAPAARATSVIALVGDSHAEHWRPALDAVARARGWTGVHLGHSGCPLSTATRATPPPDSAHCNRWRRRVFAWFRGHPEVGTVFVSQLSGASGVVPERGRDELATAVAGYIRAWRALPSTVRRIVVLRDTPKAGRGTMDCVQRAMDHRRPAGAACVLDRRAVLDLDPAALAARRMRSPRVRVVDLTRSFCDARRCRPVIGGVLVHKDTTHVTEVFARTLAPYLGRALDRLGPLPPQGG